MNKTLLRYPGEGLISVLSLLTEEPLGVAVAAEPLVINWINNFLQNLNANGQLSQLKARWFEEDSWLRELP